MVVLRPSLVEVSIKMELTARFVPFPVESNNFGLENRKSFFVSNHQHYKDNLKVIFK